MRCEQLRGVNSCPTLVAERLTLFTNHLEGLLPFAVFSSCPLPHQHLGWLIDPEVKSSALSGCSAQGSLLAGICPMSLSCGCCGSAGRGERPGEETEQRTLELISQRGSESSE